MRFRNRRGMTLIELSVAIVLGAGVLLASRVLLDQVVDTRRSFEDAQRKAIHVYEDEYHIRELFRNIEVGGEHRAAFSGNQNSIRFTTWCDSAVGLRGRCQVSLLLDSSLVVITNGDTVRLQPRLEQGQFRYLSDARDGGHWIQRWGESIDLPLAVGLVFSRDTTVFRIGGRG